MSAEVEGRQYTPPPASQLKASRKPQSSRAHTRGRRDQEEWDDWGTGNGSTKVLILMVSIMFIFHALLLD